MGQAQVCLKESRTGPVLSGCRLRVGGPGAEGRDRPLQDLQGGWGLVQVFHHLRSLHSVLTPPR